MDSSLPEIRISTDYSDIDQEFVVRNLQQTYWASTRKREVILKSLSHSLCYSAFNEQGEQVGFMRVITDYSSFAYLCDVIVSEEEQGRGIAQRMLKEVFANVELKTVGWVLRTKDAHGLYEKFGFAQTKRPERYMER